MITYEENIFWRILESCIETNNPAQCVSVDGPNFLKTDKNKYVQKIKGFVRQQSKVYSI